MTHAARLPSTGAARLGSMMCLPFLMPEPPSPESARMTRSITSVVRSGSLNVTGQPGSPPSLPNAYTELVPPWTRAEPTPHSFRSSTARSTAYPFPTAPRSMSGTAAPTLTDIEASSSAREPIPVRPTALATSSGVGRRSDLSFATQHSISAPSVTSNAPPVSSQYKRLSFRHWNVSSPTLTLPCGSRLLIRAMSLFGEYLLNSCSIRSISSNAARAAPPAKPGSSPAVMTSNIVAMARCWNRRKPPPSPLPSFPSFAPSSIASLTPSRIPASTRYPIPHSSTRHPLPHSSINPRPIHSPISP